MNQIVPVPQQGGWMWDGTRWVCCPDQDPDPGQCPPEGTLPPGCPPWFPSPPNQPPWFPGANGGVSFSATAPPNPVRGHFWWNGTILQLFDGAAWVAIGPTPTVTPPPGGGGGGTTSSAGAGITVISPTQPTSPMTGSLWWDGSTLRMWDGTKWINVSQTVTATQPVNPPAGTQWWNGTLLQIWDGTKWVIIGPGGGGAVATTTAVLSLTMASSLTIPPNTWSIVPYTATPSIDPMNAWNTTTRQFKPTKPGMYMFSAQVNVTTTTASGLALAKNDVGSLTPQNADLVFENLIQGGPGTGDVVTGFGMTPLNGTTDYVRLWAYSDDGNIVQLVNLPSIEGWLLP